MHAAVTDQFAVIHTFGIGKCAGLGNAESVAGTAGGNAYAVHPAAAVCSTDAAGGCVGGAFTDNVGVAVRNARADADTVAVRSAPAVCAGRNPSGIGITARITGTRGFIVAVTAAVADAGGVGNAVSIRGTVRARRADNSRAAEGVTGGNAYEGALSVDLRDVKLRIENDDSPPVIVLEQHDAAGVGAEATDVPLTNA